MSKGKDNPDGLPGLIRILAADLPSVSSGDVARAADVTRQAAHYHLSRMVETGELLRMGAGRGTRYVRNADLDRRYPIRGLEEDHVWREVIGALPAIDGAEPNVRSILTYAFTEMLNNATDHSQGDEARVMAWTRGPFAFEVHDDGVGVYRHLRERLGLEDDLAALQQLAKGRETTAPDRHTGEGIFFTSRAVDRFELDANGLRWTVDAARQDHAIGEAPDHPGTRVRWEVDPATGRTLDEVFAPFVDPDSLRFDRTVVPLRLFETEERFVSRAEAKRLARSLERFREAVIDFNGIDEVGQGFVDELFRVWARDHPETRLVPINMSSVVERVVRRASASGS
jgi:hypothetical protein